MRRLPPSPRPRGGATACALLAVLAGAVVGGCAGRGGGAGAGGATTDATAGRAARRDRNLITREQMDAGHYKSAYDAVEALHSTWLRPRGVDSFRTPGEVLVYFDEARLGGVETLRAVAVNAIASIRFLSAVEATSRWGVGHTQGVIYLSTQEPR